MREKFAEGVIVQICDDFNQLSQLHLRIFESSQDFRTIPRHNSSPKLRITGSDAGAIAETIADTVNRTLMIRQGRPRRHCRHHVGEVGNPRHFAIVDSRLPLDDPTSDPRPERT